MFGRGTSPPCLRDSFYFGRSKSCVWGFSTSCFSFPFPSSFLNLGQKNEGLYLIFSFLMNKGAYSWDLLFPSAPLLGVFISFLNRCFFSFSFVGFTTF
jgi:hypothetical protein